MVVRRHVCARDRTWVLWKGSLLTTEPSLQTQHPGLKGKCYGLAIKNWPTDPPSSRLLGLKVLEITRNKLKILNYLLKGQRIVLFGFEWFHFFCSAGNWTWGLIHGKQVFFPGLHSQSLIYFGGIFFFSNTPKMPNESILDLFEYNLNVYYLEITLEIVPFKWTVNIAISPSSLCIYIFIHTYTDRYAFVCAHVCAGVHTYRPEGQFWVSFLRSLFGFEQLLTGLVFTQEAWLDGHQAPRTHLSLPP